MPSAAHYRDAARRLRAHAARAHGATLELPDAELFGAIGPVADHHRRSMSALRSHLRQAVDELAELAGICDRRARVCEEYAAELARYEHLEWWQRLLTSRPAKPAPWADA